MVLQFNPSIRWIIYHPRIILRTFPHLHLRLQVINTYRSWMIANLVRIFEDNYRVEDMRNNMRYVIIFIFSLMSGLYVFNLLWYILLTLLLSAVVVIRESDCVPIMLFDFLFRFLSIVTDIIIINIIIIIIRNTELATHNNNTIIEITYQSYILFEL